MTSLEIISMLGGIALFLYGMSVMSTGLKNAAGDKLRDFLEKVTSNRLMGVGIGILVTLLVQSSSATDMMVIGFVSSGIMTISQALGVILGANIGTTVTAQITAFNLTAYAPLLLFVGTVMALFMSPGIKRHIGSVLLGFGMLFVGIGIVKTAIAPLSRSPEFIRVLSALENPFLGFVFGLLFTALLQSSSSSVVIFQAFAAQGLLTLNEVTFLVLGAAVGSVTPNFLASLTTGRDGKRTAMLNLLFNLFRAALCSLMVLLFPGILGMIASLSPGDVARQVANMHTFFALFSVLVALPLSEAFISLAMKLLPILPEEARAREGKKLVFLVNAHRNVPAVAMKQAQLEVIRMGNYARENLNSAITYFFDTSRQELFAEVEQTEETVDYLNHAITDALVMLRTLNLSDRDVFRLSKMGLVVSHLERISDHAENIIEFGQRLKNAGVEMSPDAVDELREMSGTVMKTLDLALEIFREERFERLPEAEKLEQQVDDMQSTYMQHHIDRLMEGSCDPLGGVIFTDMCTDLERCSDQAINIATAMRPTTTRGVSLSELF